MTKNKKILWAVLVLVLLGLGLWKTIAWYQVWSVKYDAFAQCLTDKGATFYGSFGCSHCQAQKRMFRASVDKLKYIECTPSNGKGQTQVCIDAKILGYPTWEFADGTRVEGQKTLDFLSEKTSCPLPQ